MTLVHTPTRSEFRDALIDIAPALLAGMPMGLLFGALAVAKGISPLEVLLMSSLVFAGGAQFAALGFWQMPLPILALLISTLLINARHILMSISLAPKLRPFTPLQRLLGFGLMADENWALAERRATRRPLTAGYYLGMAVVFWRNWCSVLHGRAARPDAGRSQPLRCRLRLRRHLHRPRRRRQQRPPKFHRHRHRERSNGCCDPHRHRLAVARALGRPGRDRDRRLAPSPRRKAVSVDRTVLLAILLMAFGTYWTRIAGLFLADRFRLEGCGKAAFDAIPAAVLTALIAAPTVLTTGPAEAIAGAITILAAFRLPLYGTVAVGVIAIVVLRTVLEKSTQVSSCLLWDRWVRREPGIAANRCTVCISVSPWNFMVQMKLRDRPAASQFSTSPSSRAG